MRAICGSMYMLTQDEELWAKELLPGGEELLAEEKTYWQIYLIAVSV